METRLHFRENSINRLGSVLEEHLVKNNVRRSRDSDKGYQIDTSVNASQLETD